MLMCYTQLKPSQLVAVSSSEPKIFNYLPMHGCFVRTICVVPLSMVTECVGNLVMEHCETLIKLISGVHKHFFEIKTEASGWPVECNCDQTETCNHRRGFLRDFELKEGVTLNEKNVERNEGLPFISKILLSSFWGYLGMRENLPKTRYVNNYPDVVKYFTSNFSHVIDTTLVGEDLMLLQYQMIDDAADIPRKSNVVLAAFTATHARSILYQHILKMKNPYNVLYRDTDSIMYIDDQVSGLDAHRDILIGSHLGDMTDGLPKTVTVDNFFSGGPKFYRINGHKNQTAAEYIVFKVKGLTINRAVEKTFDIKAFKKLVLQEVHELRSPFSSMRRCVETGKTQTQFCKKID